MDDYSGIIKYFFDFQTLLSGILAIFAAGITAWIIWTTAFLPIRHKEKEDGETLKRKQHYVALILAKNFDLISMRAKLGVSTVITVKAANAQINDQTKERMKLKFDPIINDWELMSLFPLEILTSIVNLRRLIEDHHYDMERAGGAFGDDNFGDAIKRRLNSIEIQCLQVSKNLNRFILSTNVDCISPNA